MSMARTADFISLWIEPATREINLVLHSRLVLGDRAARDEMIQRNIGLVMKKVDLFLVFYPSFGFLRDDLICEGLIALVTAVDQMMDEGGVNEPNPTSLMATCVYRAIGTAIEGLQDMRVPKRTHKRKLAKNKEYKPPIKEQSVEVSQDDKLAEELYYDPTDARLLYQIAELCCETETEKQIIELREKGYVDREIASELKMPLTTIYVMRRTIYARFLEVTGWKGTA